MGGRSKKTPKSPSKKANQKSRQDTAISEFHDADFDVNWRNIFVVAVCVTTPYIRSLKLALMGEQEFLQYDDTQNFRDNVFVRGLSAVNIQWAFADGVVLGVYEPISWVFKMTVSSFSSLFRMGPKLPSASMFAIVSIAMHVTVAVCAYVLWRRIAWAFLDGAAMPRTFRRLDNSLALSTVVLGVHPLRVESVRWLSAHGYPLSSIFVLISLYAHVESHISLPSHSVSSWAARQMRRFLSCILLACAVLSKASCVTAVLANLLVTISFFGKYRKGLSGEEQSIRFVRHIFVDSIITCLPFLGVSTFGAFLATRAAAADPQPGITHHGVSICIKGLKAKLLRAALALQHYFWKTMIPVGLKYRYYAPINLSFSNQSCVLAVTALLLVSAVLLTIAVRKTFRGPSSELVGRCWIWWSLVGAWGLYLALLLPTLGIIGDHVCSMASDRYTYLPHFLVAVPIVAAVVESVPSLFGKLMGIRSESCSSGRISSAGLHLILIIAAFALGFQTTTQTCLPWNSSEALWRHAITVDPHDEKAILNLAMVISQNQTRLQEAIELYELCVAISPLESDGHSNLGVLLAATGRSMEADASLQRALELDPTDWQVRGNYAKALESSGKFEEAREMYEKALQNMDSQEEVKTITRKSWTKRKAAAVKQSYEAVPRSEIAFNLAELYRKYGQIEETTKALSRVLDINPKHTGALLNLGNRRLDEARRKELSGRRRKTKIEEAIGFYMQSIEYAPDYALAYSQLGTALQMSGDMASSMKALEEAVKLDPTFANAWFKLAHSNNQAGNWEVARDAYRRVIGLDPTRVDAHLNLGIGAQENGETMLTIEAFKNVVELDPMRAEVWFNLGQMLTYAGLSTEGDEAFGKAAALDPTNIGPHIDQARAHAEAQLHAQKASSAAVEIDAVDGSSKHEIGAKGSIDL